MAPFSSCRECLQRGNHASILLCLHSRDERLPAFQVQRRRVHFTTVTPSSMVHRYFCFRFILSVASFIFPLDGWGPGRRGIIYYKALQCLTYPLPPLRPMSQSYPHALRPVPQPRHPPLNTRTVGYDIGFHGRYGGKPSWLVAHCLLRCSCSADIPT